MKHSAKILIEILCAVCAFVTSGCIHTYPDGNAVDPTLVRVGVETEINFVWSSVEQSPFMQVSENSDAAVRLTVEFLHDGKSVVRHDTLISYEDCGKGAERVLIPQPLHALQYDVVAWIDFVDAESGKPLRYDVSDISDIRMVGSDVVWSSRCDCLFASRKVDFREYKDEWNKKMVVPLNFTSPIARFSIIDTGWSEFINHFEEEIVNSVTFSTCVGFSCRVGSAFDAKDGETSRRVEKPEYYFDLDLDEEDVKEKEIAAGFMFVGSEPEELTAKIYVYNSARLIVAKSEPFTFPVERGKITIIKGDFTTNYYTNDINVDHIWKGEIEIEI